jgi:hypothetical protein
MEVQSHHTSWICERLELEEELEVMVTSRTLRNGAIARQFDIFDKLCGNIKVVDLELFMNVLQIACHHDGTVFEGSDLLKKACRFLWNDIDPVFKSWTCDVESHNFLHWSIAISLEEELIVEVVNVAESGNPFIHDRLDLKLSVKIFVFLFSHIGIIQELLLSTSLMQAYQQILTIVRKMAIDHSVWLLRILKEHHVLLLLVTKLMVVEFHVLELVSFLALHSVNFVLLCLASLEVAFRDLILGVEETLIILVPGWPAELDPHKLIVW